MIEHCKHNIDLKKLFEEQKKTNNNVKIEEDNEIVEECGVVETLPTQENQFSNAMPTLEPITNQSNLDKKRPLLDALDSNEKEASEPSKKKTKKTEAPYQWNDTKTGELMEVALNYQFFTSKGDKNVSAIMNDLSFDPPDAKKTQRKYDP